MFLGHSSIAFAVPRYIVKFHMTPKRARNEKNTRSQSKEG
jgi:hypothetical protein